MIKRHLLCFSLICCLALCGCSAQSASSVPTQTPAAAETVAYQRFSATFYDAFDTVITLIGYAPDQETFDRVYAQAQAKYIRHHQVYDSYNAYEGVNNLYYVNHNAGAGPVQAEPELIDLLLYMKQLQPQLRGRVNVAMGAVLSCWHDYRAQGVAVPALEQLQVLNEHVNFDDVIVDSDHRTVQFADPALQLDLGAVAKGYATEIVATWLLTSEMPSFIISAGGNVRCGQPPRDGRARWGVGIQNPDDALYSAATTTKDVLYCSNISVVSSGDYQRYYVVDGVRYHHIIDPDTLFPSAYMRQVTVVTLDSGYADALSTALFLLPYEEGRAFVDGLPDVEAYWVLNDGTVQFTQGLQKMLQSQGATSLN